MKNTTKEKILDAAQKCFFTLDLKARISSFAHSTLSKKTDIKKKGTEALFEKYFSENKKSASRQRYSPHVRLCFDTDPSSPNSQPGGWFFS